MFVSKRGFERVEV